MSTTQPDASQSSGGDDVLNLPEGVHGCLEEVTTTFEDNLGSYGNMFDVVTYEKHIYVYGIDIYSDLTTNVTYEIYTKSNSYEEDSGKDTIEAWTPLSNGTILAAGAGTPTKIRGFDTLAIPPNQTAAFYVTLTTPDLRYRNVMDDFADPPLEGNLYVQNGDLQINMGTSVGTYPLSLSFFAPRVWSGTLHYVPEGECPSLAPSMIPSAAPSNGPTSGPTHGPTRDAPLFEGCARNDTLPTTFEGGTGAYGNMFTVSTESDEPLTITTMEFHTDFANGTLTAMVYTKPGDYVGYENEPSAWKLIAEGSAAGAGFGQGSIIPRSVFQAVHMYPNETRSFYVTLTTADIRYTRTETPVGSPIASNQHLTVGAGTGLANFPFATEEFLYHPRVFNGRLHFIRDSECLNTTSVTYSFEVEHPMSTDQSTATSLVNDMVSDTLATTSQSEPPLSDYKNEHLLGFLKSETTVAEGGCMSTIAAYSCVLLDSTVVFEHRDSLTSGDLKFDLLNPVRETVVSSLNLGTLQVTYVGDRAQLGRVRITLAGEIPGEMGFEQQTAFEGAALSFLNDTSPDSGLYILGVRVTEQLFTKESERRELSGWKLSRWLQRSSSSSSVEVTASVTGEYRPPPEIDVEGVVDDAIDADPGGFQGRVQRSNPYFEGVESITSDPASSPITSVPTAAPVSGGSKSAAVPVLCTLLPLLTVALGCYFWRRRRRRNKSSDYNRSKAMPKEMLGSHRSWIPTGRIKSGMAAFRQRLGIRNRALDTLFDAYAPSAYVEPAQPSNPEDDAMNKWDTEQPTTYQDPYAYTYTHKQERRTEDQEGEFNDECEDEELFNEYEYDDR